IEEKLIKDFRRRYFGPDHERVLNDTLYCLSLMRHHSAPIRLLDFNYSAYIAAFFAFNDRIPDEQEQHSGAFPVIWCFNTSWLKVALQEFPLIGELIPDRDMTRDDYSFQQLYMGPNPQPFVFAENPVFLNERLIIQQGLFLCPGDISKSLEDNIKSLHGWTDPNHILKFKFMLPKEAHIEVIKELLSMNISYASLFPGLDGFAKSYKQKILTYKDISEDELS
ncbi:MAG: FRG domain-containing protein, partial [Deltaproteobacteria bacterium]|nr:FRG domain-containing protein [Deltaproteobacteria bacterium]